MTFVDTDEVLKIIREDGPVNVTELTKKLGLELTMKNIARVYNKAIKLAANGHIKSKRVGGSRILWV